MSAGLRAGTSNDGYLQINGTDVLTALSSGNVGIGTATPGVRLDIFRTTFPEINLRTGTATVTAGIDTGGNFGTYGTTSSHPLRIVTASQHRIVITEVGDVGIGTTNPSSKLQIQGTVSTINNPFLVVQNDINGAAQSLSSYNFAASFTNTRGNHSYGIVSEFRINTAGDSDRPSILFRGAQASHSWNIGQTTSGWTTNTTASGITGTAPGNDEFGIGYRPTNNPTSITGWPAAYLSVNTSGHVTIPFQPAFRAVRELPTVVIQSAQRIPYNSKTANGGFDNTNSYDTSTFAFTAPVGGVYFFQASTYTQLNTESMWDIRVNGGFRQRAELRQSAGDDIGDNTIINASCVVKLAANDVVDVYWASNDVDVLATGGYISFSGCKIS